MFAAHRLRDRRVAAWEVSLGGRGSRARLTVSVSGAAAITAAASGREERCDQLVDQLGVTSGRAASWTATSSVSHPLEAGGHRLGAGRAAGDRDGILADARLRARGARRR